MPKLTYDKLGSPSMPMGVKSKRAASSSSSSSSAAAGGGGGHRGEEEEEEEEGSTKDSTSGLSDQFASLNVSSFARLKQSAGEVLAEMETHAESHSEGMVVPHDLYPKVIQVLTEVKNA